MILSLRQVEVTLKGGEIPMASSKSRRQPGDQVSEAQIAVHWQEEATFAPP